MIILGPSRSDLFGPQVMVAFMQRLDGNGYTTPFDGENQVSDEIIGDSWQSKVETIPGGHGHVLLLATCAGCYDYV